MTDLERMDRTERRGYEDGRRGVRVLAAYGHPKTDTDWWADYRRGWARGNAERAARQGAVRPPSAS